jgi:Patatin-like phospholipase
MKQLIKDIFYSFPIQLFLLHFRKYQILLLFWFLLTSTINSGFMKSFGADALFFAPEYLGNVSFLGAFILGIAIGVFIMSWNVTTFILHSKRCKFLATTAKPFLKYCINNAVLPLLFLLFYFTKQYLFNRHRELMSAGENFIIMAGVLFGIAVLFIASFIYFFGAEKTILRSIAPIIANPTAFTKEYDPAHNPQPDGFGMKVSYFFSAKFRLRKARNVSHYSQAFLDMVFKRHHIAAILSIVLAFIFLVIVGFFLDHKFFQLPAAASIFIFFGITTAVIGSLTYFLQSWSLPFTIVLIFILNILYQNDIIDPRNKAYGLNYINKANRPDYTKRSLQLLCTPTQMAADKNNMITILNNWKQKQNTEKPVMIFINVTGGGLRSATFVMNTLQHLDSITNGKLMQHTMMISGASGGMLAASYYRELYRQKLKNNVINLYDNKYTNNITQDLINPIFSSMIARDIFAPSQKFSVNDYKYVKDRGYAFEQKLSDNTEGILNIQIKDLADDEKKANIPLIIFNSTITRDGRKMMIGTQPISFMMKPLMYATDTTASPDAVDFNSMFVQQQPQNLRLLTALRMNATFPYVLPNVWLPTHPVIDIMDAGLKDNYGQETTLRFIENFKDWIKQNTGGVIILQMRDRVNDNWQQPFETTDISDIIIKPGTMLQHNWFKLQDYVETDHYSYLRQSFDSTFKRITFMYAPQEEEKSAALNFHLTAREKRDVISSYQNNFNQAAANEIKAILK